MTAVPKAAVLAGWALSLTPGEIPADVLADARFRVLDVLGLILAGSREPLGAAVRRGAEVLGTGRAARLIPCGTPVPAATAALVHGTLGHAMDFDDTHNATLVHPSVPVVATALALGEAMDGGALLAAVAIGNEVFCRLGMVAPMAFHRIGMHPTAVLGPPVLALLAARVGGLGAAQAVHAMGIAGSQASGILESFADGTWVKTLHPGWAAHAGIVAASLARAGFTGPATVLEGRFGLFRTHVQRAGETLDFDAMTRDLGSRWELRSCSLKPYACAHVIHPYVDLARALWAEGIDPEAIERVEAAIQPGYIPVVGEPREAKISPRTPTHARASLPYCVAAALRHGRLDADLFTPGAIADRRTRALAARIAVTPDTTPCAPGQFRGTLRVMLAGGKAVARTQDHNRGSIANPLPETEIVAKFRSNAAGTLDDRQADRVVAACLALPDGGPVARLIDACLSPP
jgi:2-methylcitrate dehydratase PrpD